MKNPLKIMVHGTGMGPCALTGKECDGLTVSFEDGTVTNAHLSWKAFEQLLAMKAGQRQEAKPAEAVPVNGPVK